MGLSQDWGTVARLGVRRPVGYFRVRSLAEGGYVAWILRLVKTGAEGEGPCTDVMEIRRPDEIHCHSHHSTGYVVPVEVGYGTEYGTDDYPRHAKVGGWYNTAPYNDPFLNTTGRSRALYGGKLMPHGGGRAGFYALGDQVVHRYDAESRRAVALFGTVAAPFDGRELFAFQGVVGAVWTGPIARRPFDQVAFLSSYTPST